MPGRGAQQLQLGDRTDRWRDADEAVDKVRERYGAAAVELATVSEQRPLVRRTREREP